MKNIQIEGIFFENFKDIFSIDIEALAKDMNVSVDVLLEKIRPKINEIIENVERETAELYLDQSKFDLKRFIRISHGNQKELVKRYEPSFRFFIMYVNACDILYTKAYESIGRKKLRSVVSMSMILYGMILRRAQQIVDLLISGYTDAAMIIWRSMYEYTITMMVIALEDSDELADRYFRHSLKNQKRKVESYQKNHKALKFRKLPDSTFQSLQSEERRAVDDFGKKFIDNDFGWADILMSDGKKATLRDLEEIVEFNRYRPYYLMCSEQAHTNFNGFRNFMVKNKVMLNRLLMQEEDLDGFIDPMQFTISILDEVTDYMLYTFSIPSEYNVNKEFLTQIFIRLQNTFKEK